MRLQKWMDETGTSGRALAKALAVSCATISRFKTGTSYPSPEQAQEIFRITKGRVTPNDMFLKPAKTQREKPNGKA